MKLTRLGHACVLLEGSKTIIIDPFLTDNPAASVTAEELPKVDIVLVTHDHFDHIGDAVAIAKRDNAQLVVLHEITTIESVQTAGINAVGMNIGGTYRIEDVAISLTPAVHSADHGDPTGYIVTMDGKTVYHAGDTAVFGDMALIPQLHGPIDIACLPIGGHYTMDVHGAAMALELLKPKTVIPIHYNTWPPINADPEELVKRAGMHHVIVLEPGQSYDLER